MDVALVQRRLGVRADGALGPVTLTALFTRCGAAAQTAHALSAGGLSALRSAALTSTALRLAHFVAQTGHETMGFTRFVEIWGPTPAQRRYEGRKDLGNMAIGDGYRFRGRGAIQVTGRANYETYGEVLGIDLLADPTVAARPDVGIQIAAAYWTKRRINVAADRDDVEAVTRLINGGLNGIADRRSRLLQAKVLLL